MEIEFGPRRRGRFEGRDVRIQEGSRRVLETSRVFESPDRIFPFLWSHTPHAPLLSPHPHLTIALDLNPKFAYVTIFPQSDISTSSILLGKSVGLRYLGGQIKGGGEFEFEWCLGGGAPKRVGGMGREDEVSKRDGDGGRESAVWNRRESTERGVSKKKKQKKKGSSSIVMIDFHLDLFRC